MGVNILGRSCWTNQDAQAPDPRNFEVLQYFQLPRAHVLRVRYPGCTNYEGIKVMVFEGIYEGTDGYLDPHFSETEVYSPVARFKPDEEGLLMAIKFAQTF